MGLFDGFYHVFEKTVIVSFKVFILIKNLSIMSIVLMYNNLSVALYSKFDQDILAGRVSESTHVHFEQEFFKSFHPFTTAPKAVNPATAKLFSHTATATTPAAMTRKAKPFRKL